MTPQTDNHQLIEPAEAEVPPSNHNPIPRWLLITYCTLPLWGILTFFLYWNGSRGWLDRGYWEELQKAANTTYPFNRNEPEKVAEHQKDYSSFDSND